MDAKSDILFVKTLKLMAAYISGFTVVTVYYMHDISTNYVYM